MEILAVCQNEFIKKNSAMAIKHSKSSMSITGLFCECHVCYRIICGLE